MKKITVIALAAFLFSLNTEAQVRRKVDASQKVQSDTSRKHQDHKMMKDLNLTSEQKSEMKAMRESNKSAMEAIKNDASLTQDQKKEKMLQLRKDQKAKTQALLTADQKAKIIEAQKKGKNADFKAKKNRVNDMNLSDDQKIKMKEIRGDSQKQMDAIKNDANLTQEQKTQKSKEVRKNQEMKMSSILTPEQKAKMKSQRRMKSPNSQKSTIPSI